MIRLAHATEYHGPILMQHDFLMLLRHMSTSAVNRTRLVHMLHEVGTYGLDDAVASFDINIRCKTESQIHTLVLGIRFTTRVPWKLTNYIVVKWKTDSFGERNNLFCHFPIVDSIIKHKLFSSCCCGFSVSELWSDSVNSDKMINNFLYDDLQDLRSAQPVGIIKHNLNAMSCTQKNST